MIWIPFTEEQQLSSIISLSQTRPQVIFKHSTRCNISSIALNRLQKINAFPGADFYFLDLLKLRALSDKVADFFNVSHESPQILVIRKGECVYEESHLGIIAEDLEGQL